MNVICTRAITVHMLFHYHLRFIAPTNARPSWTRTDWACVTATMFPPWSNGTTSPKKGKRKQGLQPPFSEGKARPFFITLHVTTQAESLCSRYQLWRGEWAEMW